MEIRKNFSDAYQVTDTTGHTPAAPKAIIAYGAENHKEGSAENGHT